MDKYGKLILIMLATCLLQGCFNMAVSGAQAVYDRHNLKKKFSDQYTTLQAYRAINDENKLFKDANISITTYNNQVLLTGQVPTVRQRIRAEQIVRNISDFDSVYNLLAISNPSSSLTRISDAWLTAKIKTKLIASEEVDATKIKVVTENGTVYLMGIVPPDEAQEAVQIASQTDGVERVVKIFIYIKLTKIL